MRATSRMRTMRPVGVGLENHVGELLGVDQPAQRGHGVLEDLPLGHGRLADLAGGHLGVLLLRRRRPRRWP